MAKNLTRKNFFIAAAFLFPGVALLFNTNSYHADKNNLNTAYLVVGIVLVLIGCFFGWKSFKYGNTPNDRGL